MEIVEFFGGLVFDPTNTVNGEVQSIFVSGGTIIEKPTDPKKITRRVDLSGRVVFAGAVDAHSHICGPGVNTARHLQIGMGVNIGGHPDVLRRRGPQPLCPSAPATGELYLGLGYTTVVDAAIPPSAALGAHLELGCLPGPNKAFLILAGNHPYGLQLLAEGRYEEAKNFYGWLLSATKAYGLKVVNPGGVLNWSNGKEGLLDIDDSLSGVSLTPRQIIRDMARIAEDLGLPHPPHLHCNRLGLPGNARTTLESMTAFEGRRGHITHIQFHTYKGDPNDPGSLSSGTAELAALFNASSNLTVDVGQVLFGPAMSLTGDLPAAYYLRDLLKANRFSAQSGCDGGCGVMPLIYKDKSFVHGLQWAIGLEWYLLAEDPWRIAMSTDHPNGGAFVSYPEIVALLMSETYRAEVLNRLPAKVKERSILKDLKREYSLYEIAILTRAAPARILGLKLKGHLGVGADADLCIYTPSEDKREMFSLPYMVVKGGKIVVKDQAVQDPLVAPVFHVEPGFDPGVTEGAHQWIKDELCIQPENFMVGNSNIPKENLVEVC